METKGLGKPEGKQIRNWRLSSNALRLFRSQLRGVPYTSTMWHRDRWQPLSRTSLQTPSDSESEPPGRETDKLISFELGNFRETE
jgi:hypothetical protein